MQQLQEQLVADYMHQRDALVSTAIPEVGSVISFAGIINGCPLPRPKPMPKPLITLADCAQHTICS